MSCTTPGTMDSVLVSEWTGNSKDKRGTLGQPSGKINCCSMPRVSLQSKSHILLFILIFLWLIRTIRDKKSKESQYCKKLQGSRNDLATNWVLHINVQCPLASYLSLPLYLMQEQ